MSAFWIVAAFFIAAALLLLVPPLLRYRAGGGVSRSASNVAIYRDQLRELEADMRAGNLSAELYEQSRREIEGRLLEDLRRPDSAEAPSKKWRSAAIVLAIIIPLCAVALYFMVGTPQALTPEGAAPHGLNAQQIQTMVDRLAERLKANPDDGQGWLMLGRSYTVLGRFQDAANAFAKAVELLPNDAEVLADYADVLATAQGGQLQGKPEELISQALKIDPNNPKALALAGTVAFNKKDYRTAVDYWERLLRLVAQEDPEFARQVSASIAEARQLGGLASAPRTAPVATAAPTAKGLSGVVKLAPELAGKVAPTDTVFIFARAANGPRMPLAIMRKQVRDLPITFKLDDTMAMAPEMKISNFPQLVVGARVSKSSNAMPQAGDLQGMSGTVTNGAAGITVLINTEIR
ncbi:MAG TPA: c-type cytochrome biogenesis protein CcmI [Burkholderiales bacterium]|nr:c-type cytochrome biogenesis protein CcmI [Burkholderiales bacterium]